MLSNIKIMFIAIILLFAASFAWAADLQEVADLGNCIDVTDWWTSDYYNGHNAPEKTVFLTGNKIQFNVEFHIACYDMYIIDVGVFKSGNLVFQNSSAGQMLGTGNWGYWYWNSIPNNTPTGIYSYACRVRSITEYDVGGYPGLEYTFKIYPAAGQNEIEFSGDLSWQDLESGGELIPLE